MDEWFLRNPEDLGSNSDCCNSYRTIINCLKTKVRKELRNQHHLKQSGKYSNREEPGRYKSSVTRLGYFQKSLRQFLLLGDFLGSFEIVTFTVKTAEYAFWATTRKIWATFLF